MAKTKVIQQHNKAIDSKTGKLKKKYRDLPRYKAIYGYENKFKKDYGKMLTAMTLEVTKTLVDFSKK